MRVMTVPAVAGGDTETTMILAPVDFEGGFVSIVYVPDGPIVADGANPLVLDIDRDTGASNNHWTLTIEANQDGPIDMGSVPEVGGSESPLVMNFAWLQPGHTFAWVSAPEGTTDDPGGTVIVSAYVDEI
jgi:hypothetical protein